MTDHVQNVNFTWLLSFLIINPHENCCQFHIHLLNPHENRCQFHIRLLNPHESCCQFHHIHLLCLFEIKKVDFHASLLHSHVSYVGGWMLRCLDVFIFLFNYYFYWFCHFEMLLDCIILHKGKWIVALSLSI